MDQEQQYGIKLITYRGQEFNTLCYEGGEHFSGTREEAEKLYAAYSMRNPQGF